MDLLFCIDRSCIRLLCNCLKSIVINGGEAHYTVHILHSDLSDGDMEIVRQLYQEHITCDFIRIDNELFAGFPITSRYPHQIYYRLLAADFLPEALERVLYLDIDLLVINPLREFYRQDFDGAYMIACSHVRKVMTRVNQLRLDAEKDAAYSNTGVLLMNLPELRKKVHLEAIREFVDQKKHSLILPDQDILFGLYGDKIKLADPLKYNLSDRILQLYNADIRSELIDLEWVRKNTVIVHYCGKNKPWKEKYNGRLGIFYEELINREPEYPVEKKEKTDTISVLQERGL